MTFSGNARFRFGAKPSDPELQRLPGRGKQSFPFVGRELVGERDRRELRRVQDLVGIGVADAAEQARIGQGALQRMIFSRQHRAKRI